MSNSKINKNLKFILPIWALICALLCAITFRYSFDKDIGYFKSSPLTYVFYVSIVIAIALSIIAGVKSHNDNSEAPKTNRRTMAIIMACAFAFYLVSFILAKRPAYLSLGMYALIIVGALVSIMHFLILALADNSGSGLKIFTGLAPVITPILIATASYFNHAETLNSPYKLLFEFACAAFALYYITELRAYTPAPRNKFIITTAGISITLTLCAGIAKMFDIMYNGTPSILNISSAILFAAMASCAASKLLES